MSVTDMPELRTQKNQEGHTPLQLAIYYKNNKNKWGSGIQAKDLTPIIEALQAKHLN
jgi:ankyrin repeat protein